MLHALAHSKYCLLSQLKELSQKNISIVILSIWQYCKETVQREKQVNKGIPNWGYTSEVLKIRTRTKLKNRKNP